MANEAKDIEDSLGSPKAYNRLPQETLHTYDLMGKVCRTQAKWSASENELLRKAAGWLKENCDTLYDDKRSKPSNPAAQNHKSGYATGDELKTFSNALNAKTGTEWSLEQAAEFLSLSRMEDGLKDARQKMREVRRDIKSDLNEVWDTVKSKFD